MSRSAVEKLALTILLSAIKQRASEGRLWRDGSGSPRVDFVIEGVSREELRPPPELYQPLLEQFARMADLAVPPPDQVTRGTIELLLGADRSHSFELEIRAVGTMRSLRFRASTAMRSGAP